MQSEQSILDRIKRRLLKWHGHLLRMEDSHWPDNIFQWTPHGRRRRKTATNMEVTDLMRPRNRNHGRRWTSLTFGNEWTTPSCIDTNIKINLGSHTEAELQK